MKQLKTILYVLMLTVGMNAYGQEATPNEVNYNDLIAKITKDPLTFARFHHSLLRVVLIEDRNFINTKDYKDQESNNNFNKRSVQFFMALMFSSAMADELESEVCFFGGWPSIRIDGSCKRPWTDEVRNNPTIIALGAAYDTDSRCDQGESDNFEYRRCNPILFGPGGTSRVPNEAGLCIALSRSDGRSDYSNFTNECFELAAGHRRNANSRNNLRDLYERVQGDEDFRASYAMHAEALVEFCNSNPERNGNTCASLLAIAAPAMNLMCMSYGENVTLSQVDKITSLWQTMRNDLIDLDWGDAESMDTTISNLGDSARRRTSAPDSDHFNEYEDMDVSDQAIPSMVDTIRHARRVAGLVCGPNDQSINGCLDPDSSGAAVTKDPNASTGWCWKYVKIALLEGGAVPNYIASANAYEAHSMNLLEQRGFCNLNVPPERAPIGAIMVYRKVGAARGVPGHIEIKAGENEYVSDYIGTRPLSETNSQRIHEASYVPAPCSQYQQSAF